MFFPSQNRIWLIWSTFSSVCCFNTHLKCQWWLTVHQTTSFVFSRNVLQHPRTQTMALRYCLQKCSDKLAPNKAIHVPEGHMTVMQRGVFVSLRGFNKSPFRPKSLTAKPCWIFKSHTSSIIQVHDKTLRGFFMTQWKERPTVKV